MIKNVFAEMLFQRLVSLPSNFRAFKLSEGFYNMLDPGKAWPCSFFFVSSEVMKDDNFCTKPLASRPTKRLNAQWLSITTQSIDIGRMSALADISCKIN